MIKNLEDVKRDYIRLQANEQGLWLEVCEINWAGPHEAVDVWTPIKRLGQPPIPTKNEQLKMDLIEPMIVRQQEVGARWIATPQEIEKAINQLLNNRRYFSICGRCRRLHPDGHMHDEFACQSCAEKTMDIVY